MTYFPDLAPYRYGFVPTSWNQKGPPSLEPTELYWWMWGTHDGAFELPELTVGWLEPPHEFPRGELARHLMEKLDNLCRSSNYHVTRGFHPCGICGNATDGLGSKEIRILGNGVVYAAPNKIAHYVTDHGYAPPQGFVAALEQCDGLAKPNRDVRRPITLDMIPRESVDIAKLDTAIRETLRRRYREQIFNDLSLQDCGDFVTVSTRIDFHDNT